MPTVTGGTNGSNNARGNDKVSFEILLIFCLTFFINLEIIKLRILDCNQYTILSSECQQKVPKPSQYHG